MNHLRAAAAAALMMGEDFFNFARGRPERNDFSAMLSAEKLNSASRQIYLTFPAESTFKDEDVSDYFRYSMLTFFPLGCLLSLYYHAYQ